MGSSLEVVGLTLPVGVQGLPDDGLDPRRAGKRHPGPIRPDTSVPSPSPLTDICYGDTLFCMRTTLDLDDALYQEAKKAALDAGRPVTAVIEDAIREALARRGRPGQRTPPRLPVLKGRRLASGVDLDDSAGLLDLLEGPRAAR